MICEFGGGWLNMREMAAFGQEKGTVNLLSWQEISPSVVTAGL